MLTSAPIDESVLAGVRARRRNSHFQLWLLRRPSAPPMHLPGRPAWLHWLGGELAADSGSVDVKARRQSDSTAEGAHDVQAFASAHRPFREEPATFNQRIGRHFDIGPKVHAVEHEFGCPGPQISIEHLFAERGADHRAIRCSGDHFQRPIRGGSHRGHWVASQLPYCLSFALGEVLGQYVVRPG
jgi:hypothetical protein